MPEAKSQKEIQEKSGRLDWSASALAIPFVPSAHEIARKIVDRYVLILASAALLLGGLFVLFPDLRVGGLRWFHLEAEMNLPTWFSGLLFFLLGVAATVAYVWEVKRNREDAGAFRWPFLWLPIAACGFILSLDEVAILHESLVSEELLRPLAAHEPALGYLPQWLVLLSPVILLATSFLVLFLSSRFGMSRAALKLGFLGLSLWILALLLDGIQGTVQELAGDAWYRIAVIAEEEFEMLGAIGLAGAVAVYVTAIALDFSGERRSYIADHTRFLTATSALRLVVAVCILGACGAVVFLAARKQALRGAEPPVAFEQALAEPERTAGQTRTEPVPEHWFDALPAGLDLSPGGEQAVAKIVHSALAGSEPPDEGAAEILRTDRAPRIAFLTIAGATGEGRVSMGLGVGLRDALLRAVAKARREDLPAAAVRRVKVDVVEEVTRVKGHAWGEALGFTRGIHGIAFDKALGVAFLPGEAVARTLLSSDLVLVPGNIGAYLERTSPELVAGFRRIEKDPRADFFRFTTRSLWLDGGRATRLYRDHLSVRDADHAYLLAAASLGGEYLARSVGDDGRFVYSYLPKTDAVKNLYNILRHAGTLYSMCELQAVAPDDSLLAAATRARGFLVKAARPIEVDGRDLRVIVEAGEVKLGGNALAIVALAQHAKATGDRGDLHLMQKLAGWIAAAQAEDGEFKIHKQTHPAGEVADFRSAYYPGEALLALVRLHSLDGKDEWLDVAEKGARWLIETRDADVVQEKLNHDHWLLYALNELYRKRPEKLYLEHTRRITDAILAKQNLKPELPDWRGSYYRPPRSTPTATRTEGLCAAWRLERDHGDRARAKRIFAAIRAGIDFQLQTQFGPESTLYLADPARADGGFRKSLTDYEIRIDYVQHNISALLGCRWILRYGAKGWK